MSAKGWLRLKLAWGKISGREQKSLLALAGLLVAVLAYTLVWQPTRQRLEVAERLYRQHAELSARIRQARPVEAAVADRPLSVRVNESAAQAGLGITEMAIDGETVRLVVSGEPGRLLDWLDQREREGAVLQSLTLQAGEGVLQAQLVLRQ